MSAEIEFDSITGLFKAAEKEGRYSLYEHETGCLLRALKNFTVPQAKLLEKDIEYSDEELISIDGDRLVLKIVSSDIIHKTEVGGVRIIENTADSIRSEMQMMLSQIPAKCASITKAGISCNKDGIKNFSEKRLEEKVAGNIKGILMMQHIVPAVQTSCSEMIIGIRNSREFGMIISAGTGGTDTELFAESFKKGRGFVTASTDVTTASEFLEMFRETFIYKKIAGLTKGNASIISDDKLLDCFSSFIKTANYYSPENPEASYVIEEFEINPFVFGSFGQIFPVDGMCRFRRSVKSKPEKSWQKIDKLLHPCSIGVMGVSASRMNFGRIILNNILKMGYEKNNIRIIHSGMDSFEGVKCVPGLDSLDIKLDLLVVAVNAGGAMSVIKKVTDRSICESVILITGGIGETDESKEMADRVSDLINRARLSADGGPVFLGANCLGVVSHPGSYDTLFIPEDKLPKQREKHDRNTAFISQSGAFMITRLSKIPELDPAYMISMGNQTDLTLGDMMSYLKDRDDIDIIAVYAEGFKDLDGLKFIRAVRQAVAAGKDVVFYKTGRTREGRSASGSHTASIAGDYSVCETCVRQSGGLVASDFSQFEDLLLLALGLNRKKIRGNRIAAVSGAGFETVGMADSTRGDDCKLVMAKLSGKTTARINKLLKSMGVSHLTEAKNPLDMNPASNDENHLDALRYVSEDENVDAVIMGLGPMSPSTWTLDGPKGGQYDFHRPGSMASKMPGLANSIDKPVIGIVDAGRHFDSFADELKSKGMIIFRSSDRAVRALALYINARLYAQRFSLISGETYV